MPNNQAEERHRVALVTGCSEPDSLGVATVQHLHRRGWRVIATARRIETMQALKASGIETLALDVTSQSSIDEAVKALEKLTGCRLDLLINNAGVNGSAAALDTDPAQLAAMFDVNVVGPLRMVQAFAPALAKTTSTSAKRSKIVNIGTVMSGGAPWHTGYASTKAALQSMSDVMRREFVTVGIDVITLELGLVKTAMSAQTKDFDLEFDQDSPRRSALFANFPAISDTVRREFKQATMKAPTAQETAVKIVEAVEKASSPRKIWLGQSNFLFKWIIPYLPVSAADGLWAKVMRMDLMTK